MPSNAEYSLASVPKQLTLDAIELTLILKSVGFRLESLDFGEEKLNGFKNTANINTNSSNNVPLAKTPSPPSANPAHFLNVEISCSKSKIVSRLSYKFGESDGNTGAAGTMNRCTCPSKEMTDKNNSFWEIQSTGTFVNQRRSLGVAMKPGDNLVDNDTSSNLLPVLSPKSISLTQALTQVLLNQYKNDIELGETGVSDFKKVFKTFERVSGNGNENSPEKQSPRRTSDAAAAGGMPMRDVQSNELNLLTPMSSMNVTPTDPNEDTQTQTKPTIKVNNENGVTTLNDPSDANQENAVLEDTVNTEAFSSPSSDLFTSSPNGDQMNSNNVERDANVINNLNQIRQCVDSTLLLMKLNVTHNLSHDSSNLLTVTPRVPNDNTVSRFTLPPLISKGILTGTSARTPHMANARLTPNTQSSGSISRKSLSAIPGKEAIPPLFLRSNSSVSLTGRLKPVPLKRSVGSTANRTLSGSETSSARSSVTSKTRLVSSSISRRSAVNPATTSASAAAISTGARTTIRKTVATTKAVVSSKINTGTAKPSTATKK